MKRVTSGLPTIQELNMSPARNPFAVRSGAIGGFKSLKRGRAGSTVVSSIPLLRNFFL